MDANWIKQVDVGRRRYAPLTWIPLYLNKETGSGEYGELGCLKDIEAVRTAAIHLDKRTELEALGFVDLPYTHGPSAWEGYTSCDIRRSSEGEEQGVYLALHQSFAEDCPSVWSLNQDFVFALGLAREGDVWIRPSEGFVEVAKIERGKDDDIEAILVRPEYLRDYLAARSMALIIGSYRERRWVVSDLSGLPFKEDEDDETTNDFGRHNLYVRAIVEGGFPYGGGVAVFNASRTDQWDDDEVPMLGPETAENTSSSHTQFTREGEKLFSISSERRLTEWLEPAALSARVRRDKVPSTTHFIVDAQGSQTNADQLKFEEVGLWLFFRPTVISDILSRRGSSIKWHTRFTASVSLSGGIPVHFGTNKADLVVAYAYDVARQPEWQRKIWAAHNVPPEGGLGEELDAAQVRARPTNTLAPEGYIAKSLEAADAKFKARFGTALIRVHQDTAEIISRSHRFRSLDQAGFLSLAKDLARLSADLIDQKALHAIEAPSQGQGTGSLRSLERVLETLVGASEARRLTSKLLGIYKLRLSDAHLPSSALQDAMKLAEIPTEDSWLLKGAFMIHQFVSSFYSIAEALSVDTGEGL